MRYIFCGPIGCISNSLYAPSRTAAARRPSRSAPGARGDTLAARVEDGLLQQTQHIGVGADHYLLTVGETLGFVLQTFYFQISFGKRGFFFTFVKYRLDANGRSCIAKQVECDEKQKHRPRSGSGVVLRFASRCNQFCPVKLHSPS
jgi:hypothetical protein